MNRINIRKIIRWALFGMIALYIISGFGITEFKIMEKISFGLIIKTSSFRLHNNLWLHLIFIALLLLHVFGFKKKNII